ncbi:hypothetical protein [ANMV-1 virus]|nr:hypothetical protein [ANMV-1 virus]
MRNRHTNINCRGLHKLKKEMKVRSGSFTLVNLTTREIVR